MRMPGRKHDDLRGGPGLTATAACGAILLVSGGCASHSAGELPLLQETINGECVLAGQKECRVWGGNRFRKRYEYCGCRQ